MKDMLVWASDPKGEIIQGVILSFLYFFVTFLNRLFMNHYFFQSQLATRVVRASLCGLVFEHSLKLNNDGIQKMGTGRLVNLISGDLHRLERLVNDLQTMIDIPILMIMSCFTLIKFLDVSALSGVVVLAILSPLSAIISRGVRNIGRIKMKETDARVKRITETIHGIKV